jgi:carboxypeptidase C (cathepsin A)
MQLPRSIITGFPRNRHRSINSCEKWSSSPQVTTRRRFQPPLFSPRTSSEIAGELHDYTGLSVDYLLKANLRVEGGAFSKMLQDAEGVTTGRLDSRFRGPDFNRLSEEAEYDPLAGATSAAYIAAINDYVRTELKFGK